MVHSSRKRNGRKMDQKGGKGHQFPVLHNTSEQKDLLSYNQPSGPGPSRKSGGKISFKGFVGVWFGGLCAIKCGILENIIWYDKRYVLRCKSYFWPHTLKLRLCDFDVICNNIMNEIRKISC